MSAASADYWDRIYTKNRDQEQAGLSAHPIHRLS